MPLNNQHNLEINSNKEVIYRVRCCNINDRNNLVFELYNKTKNCWESSFEKEINDSYTFDKKNSVSSIDLYSIG